MLFARRLLIKRPPSKLLRFSLSSHRTLQTSHFNRFNKKSEPTSWLKNPPDSFKQQVDASIAEDLSKSSQSDALAASKRNNYVASYREGWSDGVLVAKTEKLIAAFAKASRPSKMSLVIKFLWLFLSACLVKFLYEQAYSGYTTLKKHNIDLLEAILDDLSLEDDEDEDEEEDGEEGQEKLTAKEKEEKKREEAKEEMREKRKKKKEPQSFIVKSDITFDDIIGLGDEMKDLANIVDFMKNREKYDRIGAELPKGVLLSGPPGIGKTFIAKSLAGEAGVPFLYLDGGNIEGPLVGTGSRKLKAAFTEAKKVQPSILFIDEIDSIGGKRMEGATSAYARETINALLTEMDGFDKESQVLVIGSTNLADILDEALTRSGRFDAKLVLPKPAIRQREELLEHYLSKVRTAVDLDTAEIARTTWNMVPADITNLVNTAGRNAIRKGRPAITQEDLVEASDQLSMGVGMTEKMKHLSDESKWNTSWHEAGHALVNYLCNRSTARVTYRKEDPGLEVHKVTIIPRGMSGGHTAWIGKDGEMYGDEEYAHLMAVYGGYIGEEVYQKGDITTGPSGDFGSATRSIKANVYRDMTKSGQFSDNTFIEGLGYTDEKFREEFDKRRIELSNKAYKEAKKLLMDNFEMFRVLAETLYHYEQITFEEMDHVLKKLDPHSIKDLRPSKEFVFENNRLVKAIGIKPKDVPDKVKEMDDQRKKESISKSS